MDAWSFAMSTSTMRSASSLVQSTTSPFGLGRTQNERQVGAALPTMLVVPLDVVSDPYVDHDLLAGVPAVESGTKKDCVAIPTHLRFVRGDSFEPGRVGRLRARTLAELDEKLRLVLDLLAEQRVLRAHRAGSQGGQLPLICDVQKASW
jgi:hypothetical protein